MVAALGFLEAMQIFVEFFLGVESGGVNALQLRIAFLAFPVRAGDVHQFERGDALGGRNVRAAAEIDEFSGGVEGNHGLGGFFFHQLALESLIRFLVELDGFGLGKQFALVGQILRGQLAHFGFDFGEIFGSERLLRGEIRRKSRCRSAGRCRVLRSETAPSPRRRADARPNGEIHTARRDLCR